LTKIIIPNTVRKIGVYAFSYCSKLEVFEIEKFSQLKELKDTTILMYSNIKKIILNDFDGILFASFFSHSSIIETMKDNIKYIDDIVLYVDPNSTSIVFPDNINYSLYEIFLNCYLLKKLEISGNSNLTNCVNLETLVIKNMNL
jgi:hypothetical protein